MANGIELDKYLSELRRQLIKAAVEGQDSELRFLADEVVVELSVAAETAEGVGGSLNFKVFGVGFGGDAKSSETTGATQNLILKLKLVDRDGKPAFIGAGGDKPGGG